MIEFKEMKIEQVLRVKNSKVDNLAKMAAFKMIQLLK